MECKKQENLKHCNCTYDCELKGKCCDCVAEHRAKNELPACYFSTNKERTYDRSIANFLKG